MLRNLEKLYVIFSLLYFAGALIPVESVQGIHDSSLDRIDIALQLLIFSMLSALLLVNFQKIIIAAKASIWPLIICAVLVLSTAWTVTHAYTLRRSIVFFVFTLFALYLSAAFDWEEQWSLFSWMLVLSVVGSIFMIFFFPQYGISHDLHEGDWKGLFAHKNILGLQSALAVMILLFTKPQGMPRIIRYGTILAGAVLLVLSHAVAAIAVTFLAIAAYPVLHILKVRNKKTLPLWVAFVPFVLIVVGLVYTNYQAVSEGLGKDPTLTGRTDIWEYVRSAISEKPLFGYGYSSFWMGSTRHAHNAYLDVLLDLGFFGLALLICTLISAFRRAGKLFQVSSESDKKWPLIFLVFFVIYNMGESNILRSHTYLWIPFVMLYADLGQMEYAEAVEPESELIPEQLPAR